MFFVPELPRHLDEIAALVGQFCAEVGMMDEVDDITATQSTLCLSLQDGCRLYVATPTAASLGWRACAVLPDGETVDLLTPNVEYDGYRLAAWIAEQAFMMLDFGRVA
jgi:hypothetical protein